MSQVKEITGQSTMAEVLEAFPSAQRALFQRHHIGGCSSCGFQPEDTLADVLAKHNVLDVEGTIAYLKESDLVDKKCQVEPKEVAEMVKGGAKLIDVRQDWEADMAKIEGSVLLTRPLIQEIMSTWPKDTQMVFYCHHGMRSLDAASYFIGHGFKNVRSLKGGIEAWSEQVDPSVPKY